MQSNDPKPLKQAKTISLSTWQKIPWAKKTITFSENSLAAWVICKDKSEMRRVKVKHLYD